MCISGCSDGYTNFSDLSEIDTVTNSKFINCNNTIKLSKLYDSTAIQINTNSSAGTFTRLAGSFLTNGFVAGQKFLGSGFANGGNNATFEISSISGDGLTITVTDSTGMVTETGSGDERVRSGGVYTFNNLTFSGNTYDIENTSTAPVIVQTSNGSNPTTVLNTGSGSATDILTSASLVIEIVDSDGDVVTAPCEVTIVKDSDTSILFNEENVEDGSTTYTYTSGGGTTVYIQVHNVTGYQNKLVNNYTLPSSGTTTLTVQLDTDPFYSNP